MQRLQVRWNGAAPRVFATGAWDPEEISGAAYDAGTGAVAFADSASGPHRRYAVLTPSRLRRPARLAAVERPEGYRSPAPSTW